MVLTAPSFGNTWNLDGKVVSRRLLGNELKAVADPNWPVVERLNVTYENLSTALKDAFQTDLLAAIGTEINLTDWEGTDWVGTIISDITIVEAKRGCGWLVAFEFEGILAWA